MFKLVMTVSMLAAMCAGEPSLVGPPALVVTGASSQYYARNYNGLMTAPVVAAAQLFSPAVRFVAPASILPAPVLSAIAVSTAGVIDERYAMASAPLVTGPAPYFAGAEPLAVAPAPYFTRAAPYVAAPAPFLPGPARAGQQ